MTTIPLYENAQATASATGRAFNQVGPRKFGDTWNVTRITTTTNSVAESQLRVYRGIESQGNLILTTYSGNNDVASGEPIIVGAGDKLVFVWSGADSGAFCTARLEGTLMSGRM